MKQLTGAIALGEGFSPNAHDNAHEACGAGVASALLLVVACARQEPVSPSGPGSPAGGGAAATPSVTTTSVAPPHGASDITPASELPSTAYVPKDLPLGVSPVLYAISVPANRVPTPAQIALGDKLFNDKRLRRRQHRRLRHVPRPDKGFTDTATTSVGSGNKVGQRNAPTVLNAMFNERQFWDGRAASLEDQAKLPILNPIEMGQKTPEPTSPPSCGKLPEYHGRVQAGLRPRAQLRRPRRARSRPTSARSSRSTRPSTTIIAGDDERIDAAAKRGWALFNGKGRCMTLPRRQPDVSRSSPTTSSTTSASRRTSRTSSSSPAEASRHREARATRQQVDRARARDRLLRARPLPGHQADQGHRRVQDPGRCATCSSPARTSTTARRHPVGRHRSLQQGRRPEPLPRRRHHSAWASASRDRRSGRLPVLADQRAATQACGKGAGPPAALSRTKRPHARHRGGHRQDRRRARAFSGPFGDVAPNPHRRRTRRASAGR